jgi:DNA sulfur modification protein DndB
VATTVPAITASMGSREYYIAKMSAQELAGQVAVASELAEWREATLNDLYQRKLNRKRVEQDIAPYLASAKDRFFGSIIVWVLNHEALVFEPLADHVKLLAAYASAARSIGFLVINGPDNDNRSGLVALDGQHRLAALRMVVQGSVDGEFAGKVPSDEVAVIFVKDSEVRSARDLFTVLNRSARRVSKNDVLIMSEVDGAAIVARELTSSLLLAPRGLEDRPLVKWESNTIANKDSQFTTLNAIYEVASTVAEHLGIDLQEGEEGGNPPDRSDLDRVRDEAARWLTTFFESSDELGRLRDDSAAIVAMRASGRYSLLMKPVGLVAFFGAVGTLLDADGGRMSDPAAAIKGLLRVDWDLKGAFWRGILTNAAGKVTNKKSEIELASDLAAWMVAGSSAHPAFIDALLERYRRQFGRVDKSLPDPIG